METSPAAHIAVTVSVRSRFGVSQEKPCVCSQVLKPVAAEAAAIAQPTHMQQKVADRLPGHATGHAAKARTPTIGNNKT
ncbi:MAG TPA: hypothetical protein VFW38_04520 [Solirubrobacteraceae bacterium]|nr:hypothetical protein [Solirubrobacteraceae bacterium]